VRNGQRAKLVVLEGYFVDWTMNNQLDPEVCHCFSVLPFQLLVFVLPFSRTSSAATF
jgi:hypothetical protein